MMTPLAELLSDPGWPEKVERGEIPALLVQLASAQAQLAARLLGTPEPSAGDPGEDHLLDVRQAATRLGVSTTWIYRRVGRLPFMIRLDRHVRVSAAGLERYLRARQGRHRLT